VFELVNTPVTWRKRFNLDRGAILGLSHSFANVLCFRPQMKHPHIEELYFAGCSTHPEAGVRASLVIEKLAAQQIVRDRVAGERDIMAQLVPYPLT
jgi:phytoene desaturase (3,4-didehydrolycopene-forming)